MARNPRSKPYIHIDLVSDDNGVVVGARRNDDADIPALFKCKAPIECPDCQHYYNVNLVLHSRNKNIVTNSKNTENDIGIDQVWIPTESNEQREEKMDYTPAAINARKKSSSSVATQCILIAPGQDLLELFDSISSDSSSAEDSSDSEDGNEQPVRATSLDRSPQNVKVVKDNQVPAISQNFKAAPSGATNEESKKLALTPDWQQADQFLCEFCGLIFSAVFALTNHFRVAHNTFLLAKTATGLKREVTTNRNQILERRVYPTNKSKMFECYLCKCSVRTRLGLKIHITKMHKGVKNFQGIIFLSAFIIPDTQKCF